MKTEYFSLPLVEPMQTAHGEMTEREGFLVTVEEPATGLGEACPLPGWTESLEECREALASIDGAPDPNAIDGLPPATRHGVSLALLDGAAREAGKPLYQHFGREDRVESVPVNATIGDADPDTTADRVERAVNDGFETVKLKVGVHSLDADMDRIRAVRETAPDVGLRLDANGAWDRKTADEAFDALADFDVEHVEQPLAAEDLAGHADLRGSGVGVAIDEGLYEHGIDAVLGSDAADALVVKPMAMGGPAIALEAALVARGAGIDPIVTTTVDGAIARAAAVHVAAAVPDIAACGLATGGLLRADFQPDPAPVSDGRVAVPQANGNAPATSPTDNA